MTEDKWAGWSCTELIKGKLSNKFIAFVVYSTFQYLALFTGIIPNEHIGTLLYITAGITAIFMLAGAIDQAVANAKITAEFKATIAKELKDVLTRNNASSDRAT